MLLCGELDSLLVQWMSRAYEDDRTYCVVAELRHDVLHCLLILFEESRELLVLLKQRMILDDNLRILTLQF